MLLEKIIQVHRMSQERYGSRRVYEELKAQGEKIGKNRVVRLMRNAGIEAKTHRRYQWVAKTRRRRSQIFNEENHLNREFTSTRPNEKWVSDTTQIKTRQGWLYLAVVMDLYSRRVIGWSMDTRQSEALSIDALKMALIGRDAKGVLLHSDQGVQYTSNRYREILRKKGMKYSLSRIGNCWDNAPAESFFHTLKAELVMFEDYHTREEAKKSLFDYIEFFYNRKRRHSTIAYKTPCEYERTGIVS